MKKSSRPLKTLFAKQQPKVNAKNGTATVLKAYAENDYKRIASLISKWLDEQS